MAHTSCMSAHCIAVQVARQAELARSTEAEAAAAAQARRKAARAATTRLPRPGPHLQVESQELSLHYVLPSSCSVGSTANSPAAADVEVTNTGTAAVYYSWACIGQQQLLADHGTEAGVCTASLGSLFYLADCAGVILPGQAKAFR